jgi:murein DD-endopeptidase MepM/ murein hydrolase activator NlpD
MNVHAIRRRLARPGPLWTGGLVAAACLIGGTVGAVDLIDSAGTVDRPAQRIVVDADERLPFPLDPAPMCEVFNNYGGHSKSGQSGGHQGVDIGATEGQEVYAVADGVLEDQLVDYPGSSAGNGWKLRSFHPVHGELQFRYYHLFDFAEGLREGSVVVEGQLIGYVGDTGNATEGGHHLHFEVRIGPQPRYGSSPSVDPVPMLDIPSTCNLYP